MTWHDALSAEIAVEFRALAPTMFDVWESLRGPERSDEQRLAMERDATRRRIQVLLAVGKVREARIRESRIRAWKKRRAKKRNRP